MIQVSIIVQLREMAEDGRTARISGVGVQQFKSENAIPLKTWAVNFFNACRRAQTARAATLEENARDVRPAAAEQLSLLEQTVTTRYKNGRPMKS